MNPWFGISIVLSSLTALLCGCWYIGKRTSLSAELNRKIVHMGMGLICTLFPLVFSEIWPVVFLTGSAVSSLFLVRSVPLLRKTLGSSLHGVERTSVGELLFPLSIALVWFISFERPLFYSLSVLVLTLADAFAALVGTQYGQKRYTTKEGFKTWEGSFIFFMVTFLCIHIPLLLLTNTGRAESLLIAMLIGILVMIIEAVAWRGLDNLFIPLCVCVFLNVYEGYGVSQVIGRIVLILFVISTFFATRSRSKLDDASLLGASLVVYLVLIIGGWSWGIAPLILFINYLLLGPSKTTVQERVHNIYAILAVSVPGLIWLILSFKYQQTDFFLFYNMAYMAEIICVFIAQWAFDYPEKSLFAITFKSSFVGFIMIMTPYFILRPNSFSWTIITTSALSALFSSQVFRFFQPQIRNCPLNKDRYIRQSLIGVLASVLPWVVIILL